MRNILKLQQEEDLLRHWFHKLDCALWIVRVQPAYRSSAQAGLPTEARRRQGPSRGTKSLQPLSLWAFLFNKICNLFSVYALKSLHRNYIYIGLSNNIERRIKEHNSGRNKTTKPYAPFSLVYTKDFTTRLEARTYEKYLKTTAGRRFIKTLIS